MAGSEQDELDDAVLKRAVRRACGRQTAPPALRQRIEALFGAGTAGALAGAAGAGSAHAARAAATAADSSPSRWSLPTYAGSSPWKTLAAPAACLIALLV